MALLLARPGTGWTEWWVGFRGANIDRLEQQGFLCRRRPLLRIGCSGGIERCYREIIGTVEEERVGFQPLISSIVLHILGSVLFKHSNLLYSDNPVVEKINRAKAIMRTDFGRNRSPEQIAREVGMGYTWFRRVFREYVGMAPAQYQHTMRLNKARELLATTAHSISEIAYALGFESVSAFSLFSASANGSAPVSTAPASGAGRGSDPPEQTTAVTHRGLPTAAMHGGYNPRRPKH